jgi:hypothetical protein
MGELYWRYIERPARILRDRFRKLLRRPRDNRTLIAREMLANRGRLVLFDWSVHRLLGWVDGGDDFYYVTFRQGVLQYHSCVCGFVPLHGALKGFDYFALARLFNLNCGSYEEGVGLAKDNGIALR